MELPGSDVMVADWEGFKNISKNVCRICSNLSELLVSIFDGEGLELQLHEKLKKYLPIEIDTSDDLPVSVCYQCTSVILAWHDLHSICVETDSKLKQLKLKNQNENFEFTADVDSLEAQTDEDSENEVLSLYIEKNKCDLESDSQNEDILGQCCDIPGEDEHMIDVCLIKTEIEDVSYEERTATQEEKVANSERSVSCEICKKVFKEPKNLHNHMKKTHAKTLPLPRLHKCELCNNSYKTKKNLDKHYEKEHLNNQMECPICSLKINAKKLENHLKSVHGVHVDNDDEGKYVCKICKESFKNKYARNLHMKETHLQKSIKCKLCDFEAIKSIVKRHFREVHCEKKFPCSVCGVPFKTMHTLKMHMTAHSDLRCYTCELCGMGFKRLNNVRDHMKCHEEKSNQCQICGNFFARKRYLAIHEKTIHNFYADGNEPEEKGFECGTCGAKLKWKKNLLAHMRIHTGERPYICKICKKSFFSHGSLKAHMAKHDVCAIVDKTIETLLSPMEHYELDELHPDAEMQCV